MAFEKGRKYTQWNYLLTTQDHHLQTGVPPIGVTQVPITRAHRQTTEVGIIFDQNGIVTEIQEKIQQRGPSSLLPAIPLLRSTMRENTHARILPLAEVNDEMPMMSLSPDRGIRVYAIRLP
ncbi:MAG: hypothetical protein NPIRA06_30100 [Nitrospirales bacterium]|nr:MAG: hypothetical protein NPIRA06_30100 [Nitrospirales bacterium]